jgi:hypothetical protein
MGNLRERHGQPLRPGGSKRCQDHSLDLDHGISTFISGTCC